MIRRDTQDEAAPAVAPDSAKAPRSKGMARRGWIIVATSVVTIVAVIATILLTKPPAEASEGGGPPPTDTAEVSRGDLVEQVRLTGKLAFSGIRDVGSPLSGTVTSLPAPGTVIGRGRELFRVDNTPVVLMLGGLPVWREFSEGMSDGADIRQLEENLSALGHFDETPDEKFRWSTIAAIKEWQKSLGLEQTGTIEQGRIVFEPADVRIQDAVAEIGSAAGGAIVKLSDPSKQILIDLDPNMAANAPLGAKVDVQLPNGTTAAGTITAIGSPIEREKADGGTSLKLPLTLVLDDPTVAAEFDAVTVSVILRNVVAEDVLLVPVTALLAQANGSSAVERIKKGKSEVVSVELGKFANGMVEIVAGDLAEGDVVAVAK